MSAATVGPAAALLRPPQRARPTSPARHPAPSPPCPPRSFGLIKGIVLSPLVVLIHVVPSVLISLLMLIAFTDQGYAALRL